MNSKNYVPRHNSLLNSNLALFFAGAVSLIPLTWLLVAPKIDPLWYETSLLLMLAAFSGLTLRGLRRKSYFGNYLSLHQSVSFEVVIQLLQNVSPLMPRRAFEAEFMSRETGLDRKLISGWLESRRAALPVMLLIPLAILLLINDQNIAAYAVIGLALIVFVVGMRKQQNASRYTLSVIAGIFAWGTEGTLFVMALMPLMSASQGLMLYILLTGLLEVSFIPLSLGLAELAALVGVFFGNGAESLAAVAIFHFMRLLPLLPLGGLYLARYKLLFADLLDINLITRLAQTQRPASGWPYTLTDDADAPDLSIVIPAYNEESRLPAYLEEIRAHLDKHMLNAEVLIVDDGSKDGTAAYVESIARQDSRVKLLAQPQNGGKGKAVQRGMLEGRGHYLLFADADGATPFEEVIHLLEAANKGDEIIIGSRRLRTEHTVQERAGLRALMGQAFYTFVNFFAVPGIRDTQCGFKMFRRDCARRIFNDLNESGWAFDVEVLYRAQLTGYAISEVAVNWHEVEGSKVNQLRDAIRMFVAVFRVRRNNAGFLRKSAVA